MPAGGSQEPRSALRRAHIVGACISKSDTLSAKIRDSVDESRQQVAVVLLPGAERDPEIERSYTLDLRSDEPDAIESFVRWAIARLHDSVHRQG